MSLNGKQDDDSSLEPREWKTQGHAWVDKNKDNPLQVSGVWPVAGGVRVTLGGRLEGFAPSEDSRRLPALGRVVVEMSPGISTHTSTSTPARMALDLTTTEMNPLLQQQQQQQQQANIVMIANGVFPNAPLIAAIQERYQRRLDHYMEHQVLPQLVACAALEEATVKMVKQRILQQDAEIAARSSNTSTSPQDTRKPHPPLYYTKSPNSYLVPPPSNVNKPTDKPQYDTKTHLVSTPAAWMTRIKLGCQLAFNQYLVTLQQQQQYQFDTFAENGDSSAVASAGGRRSSSRIARIVTEQPHQQRTTSKGTTNHEGVERYLKGHRIARFLQKHAWELDQVHYKNDDDDDEQEQEEQEKEQEDEEEEEAEHEEEEDVDLVNPYLQPTYGDILKSLRKLRLEDIQNSIPYWCQETTNRTLVKQRRKQEDDQEDDDDKVLEVEVLPLDYLTLGIPEKPMEQVQPDPEPISSTPSNKVKSKKLTTMVMEVVASDHVQKEHATDTNVSTLEAGGAKEPTEESAGPPLTVSSDQNATDAPTTNGGTSVAAPTNTNGTKKEEEDMEPAPTNVDETTKDCEEDGEDNGNNQGDSVQEDEVAPTEGLILQWEVPESMDKAPPKKNVYKHLQAQDHHTFGRYQFLLRRKDQEPEQLELDEMQGPDAEELQRQAEEQARRQDADRAFKDLKSWDKWRFEGIHGGHAVWPSWQDAVKKWQAERNAKQEMEMDVAMDTFPAASSADQVDADRAKALQLEKEEQAEEAASAPAAGGGRRTRRKGASSAGAVFYGQSSQLTAKQLVELILRLCSEKSTAPTILHLQSIVAEDGTQDPVRRLRTALGKLVWRRNQLGRLTPSTDWTDKDLLDVVRGKPLLQVTALHPADDTGDSDMADDAIVKPHARAEEAETYVKYLQYLHHTELLLRKTVLEHLTEIPIPIVATAADEKKDSNEGYDSADFEDQASLDWQPEGHELIGRHIFRPRQMTNTNDLSQCEWFTIKFFFPSVPCNGEAEASQKAKKPSVKESPLVDRRVRFRAAPFLEADAEDVEFSGEEYLVLTEAQARAGIRAAELEQINIDRDEEEEKLSIIDHPFAGSGLSARITLYEIGTMEKSDPIQYTVVGHDSIVWAENAETVHRILILAYATASNPTPSAVWASLDVSNDTEIRCRLEEDPSKPYRIQQSDFHPDSQAFAECRNVVSFLETHKKAGPFLQPVDPVALNIPHYTKVVPFPMDISTLSAKLENGVYSNVPPKQSAGRSPVARMLNGPFRDDVELIFDNAMRFNPPKDWIHEDANTLKKAVCRKIETMSNNADTKFRRSGRNQTRQSIYMDEDSDVDVYEYESDNDDDDDYGGSRKRKRSKGKATPKADDNCTRSMEAPVKLQKTLSEALGLRGPFANFRIENDASSFAFPSSWNCRRKQLADEEDEIQHEPLQEEVDREASSPHEEEMMELMELQRTLEESESSGLRRSTRAQIQDDSGSRRKKKGKAADIDYFLVNEFEKKHIDSTDDLKRLPSPSSRQEVEYLCERVHDSYYAKLHKEMSALLEQADLQSLVEGMSKSDNEGPAVFGSFANGSFPPFLGRMVPVSLSKHGKYSWEIRAPFQIPALRWVIRGLIQSGHLGEVEPLDQESMSSGVIMTNDVYYTDSSLQPFQILDSKELARRRRANNEEAASSEDEIELSAYEQLRAERVARNAERLKALGLG